MPIGVQQTLLSERAPAGNDANTILLLHCDGVNGSTSFPDAASPASPNTVTPHGNAKVSTAQSEFGGASFAGDGTAVSGLTVAPAANFNFGATAFTFDFWFRLNATSPTFYLVEKANGGVAPFWGPLQIIANSDGAGKLTFYLSSTGTSWDITPSGIIGATAVTANTWNHYALVRNGNVFTAYLNGAANGTVTSSASLASNTCPLAIGGISDFTATYPFNGFIDEFRVSKNARWTAPFTPPAAPYS